MYWVWCTRRTGLWQSYTAIFSNLKDINWAALRAFVSGTQMLVMAFLFLNKVALIALHSEHRYFASIKNPTTSDRIVITSQSLYFKQTHFKRHINTITGRNITVRNGFWWNSGCKTPPLWTGALSCHWTRLEQLSWCTERSGSLLPCPGHPAHCLGFTGLKQLANHHRMP